MCFKTKTKTSMIILIYYNVVPILMRNNLYIKPKLRPLATDRIYFIGTIKSFVVRNAKEIAYFNVLYYFNWVNLQR